MCYGSFQALTDIDLALALATGERIVVSGPSGSGKPTLIGCINRLETVQQGRSHRDEVPEPGAHSGAGTGMADRVIFMAVGKIMEQAPPHEFFSNPRHETTRNVLGQILKSAHA